MRNYAFIDDANLHLSIKSQGWDLDYRKLRIYLANKFQVGKALIFLGYIPRYEHIYHRLRTDGFDLVFKPTSQYRSKSGTVKHKGNIDAELVLHAAAIEYNNYDQAVIVSGDGDFVCLFSFLSQKGKLLRIITPGVHYSSLMGPYAKYLMSLPQAKSSLMRQPKSKSG